MKKKKILSIALCGLLSINTVSAEVISLSKGLNHQSDDGSSTAGINKDKEAKKLEVAKKNLAELVSGGSDVAGTPNSGKYGYSIGMGYLTPDKKFGYAALKDWLPFNNNYGKGTVHVYQDPLGIMGGNQSFNEWANTQIYPIVKNAFLGNTTSGGTLDINSKAYSELEKVTLDNMNNYFVQYGNYNGKKTPFVAATLYTRWHYDTNRANVGWGSYSEADSLIKNTLNNGNRVFPDSSINYFISDPILGSNGSSGPYIAVNDYLDTKYNMGSYTDNSNNRTTVRNSLSNSDMKDKLVMPLSQVVDTSSLLSKNVNYLNYDQSYLDTSKGGRVNNAVLEKRFEFRKYLVNQDKMAYEYLYGYEHAKVSTESAIPNKQPDVAVSVKPNTTSPNGKVLDYTLNTKIIGVNQTYNSPSTQKDYTIYEAKDNTKVKKDLEAEPLESEMDMWTKSPTGGELTGIVTIVNDKGESMIDPIVVNSGEHTRTITTDKDLSDCTVKLTVHYKLYSRYMFKKSIFTDLYKTSESQADKDAMTYSATQTYVTSLGNKGYETYTTNIEGFHSDIARTTYSYKTDVRPSKEGEYLEVEAKNYIFATNANNAVNFKKPSLTIVTDPKNITTQLENGIFNVKTELKGLLPNIKPEITVKPESDKSNKKEYIILNRDDIPPAEQELVPDSTKKFTEWHDEVEILELKIKAPDGTYWFDSTNGDVITPEVINQVHLIIKNNNLSANPTQVGEGLVEVLYKYTYNYRTETELIENTELILDASGNLVPKDYKVWYETHSISRTEKETKIFNIYSITGNTVN